MTRPIDQLALEKIDQLRKEAYEKDLDVDFETASLVPYATDMPRESRFERDDEGDTSSSRIEQQGWE